TRNWPHECSCLCDLFLDDSLTSKGRDEDTAVLADDNGGDDVVVAGGSCLSFGSVRHQIAHGGS
ncbi:hypothetical protein Dimus_037642, partial [Dionaea muscipula]